MMVEPNGQEIESLGVSRAEGSGIADNSHCYFTVFIGSEIFGLSVSDTQTIFRVNSITRVPDGPEDVVGLVNLRGKVVTAVSLARRLGISAARVRDNPLSIGIEKNGEYFALLVDEVGDVITLSEDVRIPVPQHLDPGRAYFCEKLYRQGELLIPVLDTDRLFNFAKGQSGRVD